jgi:hypothetical protein
MCSKWSEMHHGVPQDSVLGPALFLLCINDLSKIINNTSVPILFADDTSIFTHHKTDSLNTSMHNTFEIINGSKPTYSHQIMQKHNVFNLEQKMLCKLIATLYKVTI